MDSIARAFAAFDPAGNETFVVLKKLSKREADVLALIVAGMRSPQIAAAIGISLRTVKMHRGNVMAKSGVSNVVELLALYHKQADQDKTPAQPGSPP